MALSKNEITEKEENIGRRKFLSAVGAMVGSSVLSGAPFPVRTESSAQSEQWTVGKVMDLFISEVPGAPFPNTVDTLKAGSRETVISGIVTSMFPTIPVIRKTIELGANFIIVHEPSFYNHLDDTGWLANDEVYRFKSDLLKKHNIAIWRNHDYIHSLASDGVREGVVAQLEWEKYYKSSDPVLQLPASSLKDLISHVKVKLGVPALRFLGDLNQRCEKILLMPGAAGGRRQIEAIGRVKRDVLICGEVAEWETPEYVRDAIGKGEKLSLIVIGHSASEEGGSEFMATWLKKKAPSVKVTHVPSYNSLSVL